MPTANEKLLDEAVHHAIDLQGYSNGVVRRLIALINRVDADLFTQLQLSLDQMDAESFTVQRLEGLLISVRSLNRQLYEQLARELTDDLRGLTGTELAYQKQLFESVLPVQVPLAQVAQEQVYAAAMSRPFQGRLLSEWASSIEADRMARIRDSLRIGYVEGKTVPQMVREIRGTKSQGYADGIIEIDRRHAESVVRTAISHTAGVARDNFLAANADLVKAITWAATLDSRTSHTCFPGTTFALPIGDLLGVSRRHWNGDVVVVTTASGKQLRATPNHPVLTARGWRAIQEVEPGTDVLYRVAGDVGGISASENVEVPATLSAVFNALHKPSVSDIRAESTAKVDFHGDGMAGYHEINYPRTQGDLRLALEAAFGEQVAKQLLVFVGVPGSLPSESHPKPVVVSLDLVHVPAEFSSNSVEHGVQATLANPGNSADCGGLSAANEHLDDLRFISAACCIASSKRRHDAGPLEHSGDGSCCDAVASSNCGSGLTSCIAPDDVVSVVREFFSGHVFNLSTSTASYIADGFVVHNCRIRDGKQYSADDKHKPIGHSLPWLGGPGRAHWNCRSTQVPVLKSWKELGSDINAEFTPAQRASMDGAVPAETTYSDWLNKQSKARQEEILGPVRAKLLREGGLKVEQFSNDKGRFLTLEQLRERNASAFKRAGL